MIALVVDNIEPWFKYIWQQFSSINKLETEYKILTYGDFSLSSDIKELNLLIEYSKNKKYPHSLFIPKINKHHSGRYHWIREDLPVFYDSFDVKREKFDIFFNAFVHLGRLEEWLSEKRGIRIHSYAFRHPRKNKNIWKIPIVNLLFNLLEKIIVEKCPNIQFGKTENPVIHFSHDVDYIRKTIQLRIKQSAFNLLNATKSILSDHNEQTHKYLKSFTKSLLGKEDYLLFDKWVQLEEQFQIKSTYYFYAGIKSPNYMSPIKWVLDPSYQIENEKKLIAKCRELLFKGHEIGLHGSYFSAGDINHFKKEKNLIEDILKQPVTKSRQHWLNYIEAKTPYIHSESGIKFDSSLGYNDICGFRSGIASIYNPYDHIRQTAFEYKEIPLVLMDAHLNPISIVEDYKNLFLNWIGKVKTFNVAVDWHQRGASPDYSWINSYKTLCQMYRSLSEN